MTAPDRIACCIPFCGRTAARSGKFGDCEEIICGKHYRLASATLRRRLTKVRRIAGRTFDQRKHSRCVERAEGL